MKFLKKTLFLFLIGLILFSSCSLKTGISEPVYEDWKIQFGDNQSYSARGYKDSTWNTISTNKIINMQNGEHYLWLRKTITIPASLQNSNIFIGFQKTNCAIQVFADGVFVGARGNFPPDLNVKIEQNTDVLIPANCIKKGTVEIALRVYAPGSTAKDICPSLDDETQGYFMNNIKNIFNQKIFLCIGVLCAFILFYALLQFCMDRTNLAFLHFVGCLFFIILYFYDMGSENTVINYNLQRSFTRACLPASMMFLMLFLHRFYNRKKTKLTLGLAISVTVLFFAAFLINTGNDVAIDTLFLIAMIPTVGVIVYGFIVTVQGIKAKQYDSIPVFVGFFAGSCCALHDIVCQVAGIVPFVWTQGFAFFCVDLSVFITLAIRESNIKKEVQRLAKETQIQKDKLSSVISKAQLLAEDSNVVAQRLNESVDAMIQSSSHTQEKVSDINNAINEQNRIREETAAAVDNLTNLLKAISTEFENETIMIQDTTRGTQEIINGISTVGEGISTAAQFTSSLSKLTQTGSDDMKKLMAVMKNIQDSSTEILGVASTLSTFAHKIDLLSMNASIEAAHSGEAGKGFAVIAHEIKELAAQTSQWSGKIAEIITSIIGSIDSSADLTSKVNQALLQIEDGSVKSAERVNAAWEGMKAQQSAGDEISKDASSLATSAAHMKTEIASQDKFAASVMNNMQDLCQASQAVNDASNGISAFTETLSKEAQNLAELAENTAKVAHELIDIMNLPVS